MALLLAQSTSSLAALQPRADSSSSQSKKQSAPFCCAALPLRPKSSTIQQLSSSSLSARAHYASTLKARFGHGNSRIQAALKWILEPCGDGDMSHLDEAVEKPGAIDLTAEAALVGRVADRCDIVIPVPTVSSTHARLEQNGEQLVIIDLDSTNGTFLDNLRIKPGQPVAVPNGSVITFGDQHLAMFKVLSVVEAT